ncbi:MAG: right-handed parallel beta-helix repeat-containing protein [bacterium]|nr:right-handed parallel beta-helix repeat-containing protein [bacterium]
MKRVSQASSPAFIAVGRSLKGLTTVFAWSVFSLASATLYEVGPARRYVSIGEVPWESLEAGDVVLIYCRDEPYREKWVICREGTEPAPIIVRGIPNKSGKLPTIEGIDATTRSELNYWNEERGVIKIGGANSPPDCLPKNIVIENLDIKSGRPPYSFTGRYGHTEYSSNASAIYVEKGENITIRNCILRDCGNGFFCASGASNVLVEGCYIYDNGIEGSIYEHNNYTEANGIVFQYNHFGPLRDECLGNNLKDRSAGCVVRYNWIESGNRQLDLVDSDHSHILESPTYRATYVYGNILIEPDGAGNSQVCHYGGDSGDTDRYRKGILYFYNNTVISTRAGNTTLFRLSSADETCDCRNNIVYTTASGSHLAVTNDKGTDSLTSNWLKENWTKSHSNPEAIVNDLSGNIVGAEPGFLDFDNQKFGLVAGSACVDNGGDLASAVLPGHDVLRQYVKHQRGPGRYNDGKLDIGALEYDADTDEDGIPDRCELRYFSDLTEMTPSSDHDGDGLLDWQECVAGTNPRDSLSRLAIEEVRMTGGSEVVLDWLSVAGARYAVTFTPQPTKHAFVRVAGHIQGTPPANTYTLPLAPLREAYYRVEVEE